MQNCFSADQQQLYERHLREGCDLHIDADYVKWLRIYHPESCPIGSVPDTTSVIARLSDVTLEEPIAITENETFSISTPIATALLEEIPDTVTTAFQTVSPPTVWLFLLHRSPFQRYPIKDCQNAGQPLVVHPQPQFLQHPSQYCQNF